MFPAIPFYCVEACEVQTTGTSCGCRHPNGHPHIRHAVRYQAHREGRTRTQRHRCLDCRLVSVFSSFGLLPTLCIIIMSSGRTIWSIHDNNFGGVLIEAFLRCTSNWPRAEAIRMQTLNRATRAETVLCGCTRHAEEGTTSKKTGQHPSNNSRVLLV